ncbi:piggyBac transposable element-derived protein 1-like [Hydractinia symbiolongicarpus]|uniref:piggyBac transposable element-derived protein 1-like n=1 Tax=Hydractinia symbiolongicarpus TaxID=13093 RepID=UPI00254CDC69|nr:piggyBac transposable element-derived protein 1-like [Hydractinia symbiolongicarpus]
MGPKKARISSEEAIQNILRFIEEDNVDEAMDEELDDEDDLEELCGEIDKEIVEEEDHQHDNDDRVGDADNDASESEEEAGANHLRRRRLTKYRLVNSIAAATNLENYNVFPIPPESKSIQSIFKIDNKKKNDIIRTFQNQPQAGNVGRNNRANVITGRQGPQPKACETASPRSAFELYFTPEIVNNILLCTNRKIRRTLSKLPDNFLTQNSRYSYMKETSVEEIYAFIGLYLYRELYKLNCISAHRLFSNQYGPPIFSATMSRNRVFFIRTNLCFDDETTRDERWKHDRFAAMREVFESFNYECMSCLVPGDYLSLDETLYPMRTQISFKQYNPNKPAKYGLLLKAINAARYPYTFLAAPYSGKPQGDPGIYYVPGTEEIVKYMIKQLSNVVSLAGRNISFDRLYTSIPLALWLYERDITCVGTMQINRKGIPIEMKDFKQREPLSSEVYWQKDGPLSLSSYVVKTSNGKKNVLMLSTLEPILGTTKDDNCHKLGLYKLYDFTKGGTDIVDQRMGFHTTKTKSRKWTFVMFSYMLDTARVNSSTIYSLNKGIDPLQQKSFEYAFQLVMELVKPTIQKRSQNGMLSITKQKINLVLGNAQCNPEPRAAIGPAFAETRKRCTVCQAENAGENYSQKKKSIPCVKSLCQSCGNTTCQAHMIQKSAHVDWGSENVI